MGQGAIVRHGKTDCFKTEHGILLNESQAAIHIISRNFNNLRYTYDITLMAKSEEELKNL